MKKFVVERAYMEFGTPGVLLDEALNHLCFTIERPRTGKYPCVPEGTYLARRYNSPKHGPNTWQLENVPNRTHIQLHIANWPNELLGCIAPGERPGTNPKTREPGVLNSRRAYERFMALTAGDTEIEFTFRSSKSV